MSLGLPKTSTAVSPVTFARVDVELVERSEYAYCLDVSLCLPEGLDRCVKILTYGIWAGVPEANAFGQKVGERIIGEGERSIEEAEEVAEVHQTVSEVIGSCHQRDLPVVEGEHLARLKYQTMSFLMPFS